jgi:hypothetical protein
MRAVGADGGAVMKKAPWPMPAVLLTAVGILSSLSCGTIYRPLPSPRIDIVVHAGIYYLQSGQETPVGPLGGALESLVSEDADAVRFARRSRRELAVGVPLYLCGLAAVVVGLVAGKSDARAIAGGGLAMAGVGLGFIGAGTVNAVDAVNIYNDRVSTPLPSASIASSPSE